MIHPSERWRFVEALKDQGYYEDDLVQHVVLEYRARRRAFSERLCADGAALSEVILQARAAAACLHPTLPRIYHLEEVKGRTTIVLEHIQGRSFEDHINHDSFKALKDWAAMAVNLAEVFGEMRRTGVHFARMAPEHLVVSSNGDLRLNELAPIGRPSAESLAASPFLQRLAMQKNLGVFLDPEAHPEDSAEWETVRDLLMRMLVGSTKMLWGDFEAEIAASIGRPVAPGAYPKVAVEVLQAVHQGTLRDFSRLADRLRMIRQDEVRRIADAKRAALEAQLAHSQPEPPPPPKPVPVMAARPSAGQEPQGAPFQPTSKLAGAPSSSDVPINPFAVDPVPPSGRPTPAPKSSPGVLLSDNINPYAADPLPTAAAPGSSPKASSSSGLHRTVSAGGSGGLPTGLLLKVGAGIAAVVVLGVGGSFALSLLRASNTPPNERPTAAIAPFAAQVHRVGDRLVLDASGSKDPEQSKLSYEWGLAEPADGAVIFTDDIGSKPTEGRLFLTDAPRVRAQLLTAGKHKFTLRVKDAGTLFSEPVAATVTVEAFKK